MFSKSSQVFFSVPLLVENGFLPPHPPLKSLPGTSELERQLNQVASSLPKLLATGMLRQTIDKLNVKFTNQHLHFETYNDSEKNVAMLILTLLTQAYIWQDSQKPANRIPPVLSINLLNLGKELQRLPIMTYSDYILHNWQLIDPQTGMCLENIEPIFMLTGSKDEAWFIKIHVAIEALCARAVTSTCHLSVLTHNSERDISQIKKSIADLLSIIAQCLRDSTKILQRMKEGCDPTYFFTKLIKLLDGWEKVKVTSDDKIEIGVYFEGVADANRLHAYKGPSGAQSSIVPLLDNILGLKHQINESFSTLLHFQQFMPRQHRALIHSINGDGLRKYIETSGDETLKTAWLKASKMLASFRMAHLALVEQYIFMPAQALGLNMAGITGTGGSDPTKYLGQRYLETNNMLKAKL